MRAGGPRRTGVPPARRKGVPGHDRPARRPPAGRTGTRTASDTVGFSRLDTRFSPYLYIAPFFLIFAIFGAYPLAYTFWVSLHDWDLLGTDHPFVGAGELHAGCWPTPTSGTRWSTRWASSCISTVPQLLAALWLANLLNRGLRARTGWRMAVLVPNVTSTAAVAIVFGVLFGREFGMVNWLLDLVGMDAIDWKSNRFASWVAISAMVDWRWTGYNALIFLAAMQAIPRDLYEAAAIDGASRARQFWSVTVPLLKPTIIFCTIIATIGGLQLFTEPRMFHSGTNPIRGGPLRESQTLTMYMFENAFAPHYNFGYGSAVAWLLFALIAIVAAVNVLILRRLGGGSRPRRTEGSGAMSRLWRASPLTYLALVVAAVLSIFPIWWMFVVASRTNDAMGQLPPPVTPGGNLGANIARLFDNTDAYFADRPDQLDDRGHHGHRLGGVLLQPGRVRLRQAAVPGPQRAAAGDHRDDDGADPARRDPALPADDQAAVERPAARGDRPGAGHRVRGVHDAAVRRPGHQRRADRGRPDGRLRHRPDLVARRRCPRCAPPPPCSACSRS